MMPFTRQLGFLLGTLLVSAIPILADTPVEMISLQADSIEYDITQNRLLASQDVHIDYRKYHSKSDFFQYDSQTMKSYISGNIEIKGPSQNMTAETIIYNGKTYSGSVRGLKGKIGKLYITGKEVKISPQKVIIKEASMTGCDNINPDYIIKAAELQLYPQWGVLVAFDNWVTVGEIPSLWMPTFIYGSSDYSLLASNSSIPEFGANPREGAYIRQKFGYFIDPENTGVFSLGIAQNLGPLFSISHFQTTNDTIHVQLRLASNGSDGPEYGAIAAIDVIENEEERTTSDSLIELFDQFNHSIKLPPGQIQFGSTYRENINDSRVSKPYFAAFQVNRFPLMFPRTTLTGSISRAHIIETTLANDTAEGRETAIASDIAFNAPLSPISQLEIRSLYFGNMYDTADSWHRLFGRVALSSRTADTFSEISMTQRIWNTDNKSPFEFERKYSIQGTEIGAKFLTLFNSIQYGIEVDYDIDNKNYRNVDILVTPEFHCWRIPLRWKTIEGQFRFGVELL